MYFHDLKIAGDISHSKNMVILKAEHWPSLFVTCRATGESHEVLITGSAGASKARCWCPTSVMVATRRPNTCCHLASGSSWCTMSKSLKSSWWATSKSFYYCHSYRCLAWWNKRSVLSYRKVRSLWKYCDLKLKGNAFYAIYYTSTQPVSLYTASEAYSHRQELTCFLVLKACIGRSKSSSSGHVWIVKL